MRTLSVYCRCQWLLLAAGALALLGASTASAQPSPASHGRLTAPAPRAAKSTAGRTMRTKPAPSKRIIFEDDVVSAGRGLGGGTLVDGDRRARFSRLIPIRANFVDKLIKAGEDL